MFESFTIAPEQPNEMTAVEQEVADAQAAEFDDEPLLEVNGKTQAWIVVPEPRLEVLEGQHTDGSSEIAFRPVFAGAFQQGDNGSATIVADTVQFLDPPGARSGEGGATETDGRRLSSPPSRRMAPRRISPSK